MASLLSLSPELLLLIARSLAHTEDLYSLVATCQKLYKVINPLLSKFDGNRRDVRMLLNMISKYPIMAEHVKSVTLAQAREDDSDAEGLEEEEEELVSGEDEILRDQGGGHKACHWSGAFAYYKTDV
ncbi:hypothetical protein BP5796_12842 [Coleophoma crateriformis]|uniref:F-box domain-containing protein n=1 Tax=Coleophoma crateriformis TaxID=565419 RepID=A0A3D8Q6E1_9HELO|nr:hypothetical protein BP5796_12842 [Coleophoma crateriformis]